MIRKLGREALLTILFVLVTVSLTHGQTINGNITGSIVDQQGATLPGATVTATNAETGFSRTTTTNDDGAYRISGLPVGIYNIRTEKVGFAPILNAGVQVNVGTDTELRVELGAGSVEATVEV